MYCTDGIFGYGYYWHLGNSLFVLILFLGIAVLVYWLIMNGGNRFAAKSVAAKYFHSAGTERNCPSCNANIEETYLRCPECNYKLKSNCPSCGKVVKTSWDVCAYCETNIKL